MTLRFAAALLTATLALPAVAQLKAPAPAATRPAAPAATIPSPVDGAGNAGDLTKDPVTLAKEAAGRAAAETFLKLLDAGQYEQAWEGASGLFKSRVTKANWMQGMPAARKALGAVKMRAPMASQFKTELAGAPPGEYVTTVFVGRYADRPELEEFVTVTREGDGVWRMTGFYSR